MSIEKIITLKIVSFDLDKSQFGNLIELLNTDGYKFRLSELPCYGFEDEKNNIQINLHPKNKVEFITTSKKDLFKLKKCAEVFLTNAALFFKAISLEFGRFYTNEGNIKNVFIKPEFANDHELKYKLATEIKSNDKGEVYFTTNYHFYNFNNINNENGIAGIIKENILDELENYYDKFESMFR